MIDPWLRTVEILELGRDGRYVRAFAGAGGAIEQVPGMPGLSLDLDAMWAEIHQLPVDEGY